MTLSSSQAPIEFLPPNRHPLEHLSKLLSSFCNPLDATEENDDDENGENDETLFPDIVLNPECATSTQDSKVITNSTVTTSTTTTKAYNTWDDEYELVMHYDANNTAATTTTTATVTTIIPPSIDDKDATVTLTPKVPEGILKSSQKKKSRKMTAVVVDSGRGYRIYRILETTIFTVLVVMTTIVMLRRLGHGTDLNFLKSSNPPFPIQFNVIREVIVDVVTNQEDASDETLMVPDRTLDDGGVLDSDSHEETLVEPDAVPFTDETVLEETPNISQEHSANEASEDYVIPDDEILATQQDEL